MGPAHPTRGRAQKREVMPGEGYGPAPRRKACLLNRLVQNLNFSVQFWLLWSYHLSLALRQSKNLGGVAHIASRAILTESLVAPHTFPNAVVLHKF